MSLGGYILEYILYYSLTQIYVYFILETNIFYIWSHVRYQIHHLGDNLIMCLLINVCSYARFTTSE